MKSIFISSTFKDMQSERDLIQYQIFPRLRKDILKYGEDINFIDLRWGVDTIHLSEQESGRLVLKVCIDAINRCVPFVIVFLGERYGWIPEEDIIHSVQDTRVEEHYKERMSITNLEIEYGAFSEHHDIERCIFCLRDGGVNEMIEAEYKPIYDCESEFHLQRLSELKEKIRKDERATVIEYNASWDSKEHKIVGLEVLGEALYQALKEKIELELANVEIPNTYEAIQMEMNLTKEQLLSTYVNRYKDEFLVLHHLDEMFAYHENQNIYIKAKAGTGKTAFMSKLSQYAENCGMHTILYFAGNNGCQSYETFKEYLIYQLESILGIDHKESYDSHNDYLASLNKQIKRNKVVICFIDALDQLFEGRNEADLDVLNLCSNVLFVVSSLDDFSITNQENVIIQKMENLLTDHARQLIHATTMQHGKKVDDEIIRQITDREHAHNPLYLSNLLQRLFMISGKEFEKAESMAKGIEGIHQYMELLLSQMPEGQEEMVIYLISEAIGHFQNPQFQEILELLAVSRGGLTENELREILALRNIEMNPLLFAQIVTFLYDVFVQKENGKWTFKHRLFKEAVLQRDTKEALQSLCEYALLNEEFKVNEGYYYLLENKDENAGVIFEKQLISKVEDYLVTLISKEESYGDYLYRMAMKVEADRCFDVVYKWNHQKLDAIKEKILHDLYDSGKLSVNNALTYLEKQIEHFCYDKEKYTEYKNEFKRLVQDDLYGLSRYYYMQAEYVRRVERNYEKASEYAKKAIDLIKKIEPMTEENLLQLSLYTMHYVKSMVSLGKSFFLIELEVCLLNFQLFTYDHSSRLYVMEVRLLALLCRMYTTSKEFNIEKAAKYRDEAIKKCEELVKIAPTIGSMYLMEEVMTAASYTKKTEYQYKYLEQSVDYMRQAYQMTLHNKEKWFLGDALTRYADKLVAARKAHVRFDDAEKTNQTIKECYLEAAKLYLETAESGDPYYAGCAAYAKENEVRCAYQLMAITFKETYKEAVQKLKELVKDKLFSEVFIRDKIEAYLVLMKHLVKKERAYQEALEAGMCLKEMAENAAQKRKTISYYVYLYKCYAYLAEIYFELREDNLTLEYFDKAIQQFAHFKTNQERDEIKTRLMMLKGIILMDRGEDVSEIIAGIAAFKGKYKLYPIGELSTRSCDMISLFQAVLSGKYIGKIGLGFAVQELCNDQYSVRIRETLQDILYGNAIRSNMMEPFAEAELFGRKNHYYPKLSQKYKEYLNQILSREKWENAKNDILEIRAHYAMMDSEIQVGDENNMILARHLFQRHRFEHVLEFYDKVNDKSLFTEEDHLTIEVSKAMIAYENGEPVPEITPPASDGGQNFNLKGAYYFIKMLGSEDKQEYFAEVLKTLSTNSPYVLVLVLDYLLENGGFAMLDFTDVHKEAVSTLARIAEVGETAKEKAEGCIYAYETREKAFYESRDWEAYFCKICLTFSDKLAEQMTTEMQMSVLYYYQAMLDRQAEIGISNMNLEEVNELLPKVEYMLNKMREYYKESRESVGLMDKALDVYLRKYELTKDKQGFETGVRLLESMSSTQKNEQIYFLSLYTALAEKAGEKWKKPLLEQLSDMTQIEKTNNISAEDSLIQLESRMKALNWTEEERSHIQGLFEQTCRLKMKKKTERVAKRIEVRKIY